MLFSGIGMTTPLVGDKCSGVRMADGRTYTIPRRSPLGLVNTVRNIRTISLAERLHKGWWVRERLAQTPGRQELTPGHIQRAPWGCLELVCCSGRSRTRLAQFNRS